MSVLQRIAGQVSQEDVRRLVRYIVVGLATTGTYFAAYTAAILIAGAPVWLAACTGFITGIGVSYIGNAVWTFEQKTETRSAIRFLTVVGTSFTVNLAIAALLEWAGVHYLIIFCVEAVVLTGLNYAGHMLWTFRSPGTSPQV